MINGATGGEKMLLARMGGPVVVGDGHLIDMWGQAMANVRPVSSSLRALDSARGAPTSLIHMGGTTFRFIASSAR